MVVGSSSSYSFIIDSVDSRNMASMQDSFSSLYPYSGPSILVGDDLEIQSKEIGRIDLEDGYFNNVLFVLDISVNLLYVYKMKHTVISKRVKFNQIMWISHKSLQAKLLQWVSLTMI